MHNLIRLAICGLLMLFVSIAQAKDIRLVVPYVPGGMADKMARLIQNKLSQQYQVIVEYRTGAGGALAFNYVAQQRQQETVLMIASNGLTDGTVINKNIVTYDLSQDFVMVKHLGSVPTVLVVANSDPASSFQDLVRDSMSRDVTYGSSGVGSGQHISAAVIAQKYNNFVHVPYKGGAQAMTDVLGGNIRFLMESPPVIDPLIKSQRLRALAVLSPQRVPGYANVPTFRELGVEDYNYVRWFALVANAGADQQDLANIARILDDGEITTGLKNFGFDHFLGRSESNNFLIDQQKKFRKIADYVKLQ